MSRFGRVARGVGGEFWFVTLLVVSIGFGVVAIISYLPHAMTAAALEAAHRSNVEVADQIKITRGYYTKNVVAKALDTNALVPSYNHTADRYAIPLPATFVKDISELLAAKDTSLTLVSPYPWPHRADRKMDDFQSRAWDEFQQNPDAIFSRQEFKNGNRVLRVAVADRMTGEACVSCHNTHPESAKTDWKLGDVRAVMEVTKVIEPYLAGAERRSTVIAWSIGLPAAILAAVLIFGAFVTARYNLQKRLADHHVQFLAQHDAMTGVLNRASFIARLSTQLETQSSRLVVYYIDLDGFKDVNDKLGHRVGDLLLKEVAARLRHVIPVDCLLARLGGDEFVISCDEQVEKSEELAQRVVTTLASPFDLPNHQINISASVGVAVSSATETTAERLLEAADLALYKAKSSGRNRHAEYVGSMRDEVLVRRGIEKRVRLAVTNNLFELNFQPLFSRDKKLAGFEALLRLPDGAGGYIPPVTFIPLAEEMGLIREIGAWVIRRACHVAATWPAELTVAVNLSPAQFRGFNAQVNPVSTVVQRSLSESGLSPNRLELEITEGLLLEASEDVLDELRKMKQTGVAIVMDDFGTGHSGLSYFWKIPFDKIKIDRSFVSAPLDARQTVVPILDTIIALGRTLKMQITAEGIETDEQAKFCLQLDCDYFQGYFYGRPIAESDVAALILREFIQSPERPPLLRASA